MKKPNKAYQFCQRAYRESGGPTPELRRLREEYQRRTPPRGLFSLLTPEQQKLVMEYDGPIESGRWPPPEER